jgi:hypothetical protein
LLEKIGPLAVGVTQRPIGFLRLNILVGHDYFPLC